MIFRHIKQYGNWPTIPQLYIDKNLIGGCDIIVEMYHRGDLTNTIKNAGITVEE